MQIRFLKDHFRAQTQASWKICFEFEIKSELIEP